jgi:hypothetical protein
MFWRRHFSERSTGSTCAEWDFRRGRGLLRIRRGHPELLKESPSRSRKCFSYVLVSAAALQFNVFRLLLYLLFTVLDSSGSLWTL